MWLLGDINVLLKKKSAPKAFNSTGYLLDVTLIIHRNFTAALFVLQKQYIQINCGLHFFAARFALSNGRAVCMCVNRHSVAAVNMVMLCLFSY